jgi:hypothetical protein
MKEICVHIWIEIYDYSKYSNFLNSNKCIKCGKLKIKIKNKK